MLLDRQDRLCRAPLKLFGLACEELFGDNVIIQLLYQVYLDK